MQTLFFQAERSSLGLIFFLTALLIMWGPEPVTAQYEIDPHRDDSVVRVIVQLDLPYQVESRLNRTEIEQQRAALERAQDDLLETLAALGEVRSVARYKYIPFMALELQYDRLNALQMTRGVLAYEIDRPTPIGLSSSLPVIGVPPVHEAGIGGAGQTVAVLDTGVDREHTAFLDENGETRIVAEGCFSSNSSIMGGAFSVCPGGAEESAAVGAGDDCIDEVEALDIRGAKSDCKHGTHVAGIVGGRDTELNILGVAPEADLIAIQVFSAFADYGRMLSFTSDQIGALEMVYELRDTYDIAAVNMSLGSGDYDSQCASDARSSIISLLRESGIATVIAAGNEGNRQGIGSPACVPSAVSVGASDDQDNIATFSNISEHVTLVAPGSSIKSSVPGGTAVYSGTSMAAPLVAGTFALLGQAEPAATVDTLVDLLRDTAVSIDDERSNGFVTDLRRIDVEAAIIGLSDGLSLEIELPENGYVDRELEVTLIAKNETFESLSEIDLSVELSAGATLVLDSLGAGGSIVDNQLRWQAVSLSSFETVTRTFRLMPTAVGALTVKSSMQGEGMPLEIRESATSAIGPAPVCTFFDGFDADSLQTDWSAVTEGVGGTRILTGVGATDGEHALLLEDYYYDGVSTTVSVILTADLSQATDPILDFWWAGFGGRLDIEKSGLFISDDYGASWQHVAVPSGQVAFERELIHLKKLSDPTQFSFENPIEIKFQFSGDGPFDLADLEQSNALLIDEVQLNCGAELTWDGEAGDERWSNPRNWSPDLEPRGNSVRFGAASPGSALVDLDFNGLVADLTLSAGYGGTITQTGPLTITGSLIQSSGTLLPSVSAPLVVEGAVRFEDGLLRQSQTISAQTTRFFDFTDFESGTEKAHGGIVIDAETSGADLGEVTVTWAGALYGSGVCDQLDGNLTAGLLRCFDIDMAQADTHTLRLYLSETELGIADYEDDLVDSGEHATTLPRLDALALFMYKNDVWQPLDNFEVGRDERGIYVEGELEAPLPIAAIGPVEVPTAVSIKSFGIIPAFELTIFSVGVFLLLLLATVGIIQTALKR